MRFRGLRWIVAHAQPSRASMTGAMSDQATENFSGTPTPWNTEQAARAMASGVPRPTNEGSAAEGSPRRSRINTPYIAAGAILCLGTAILWSLSAIPRHADGTTASMSGEDPVSTRNDRALPEHRNMSSTIQSNDRTNRSTSRTATTAGLASMVVAGAVTAAAIADTAGHRYAEFHDARATIDVAGPAVYDPQAGYTAECRIWLDTVPTNTDPRFPASIMFQHQGSVDHKWLAINAGRGSGLAVGECRSWYLNAWAETSNTLPTGRWVHFAYVVRDGIDRTYVDGLLSSETNDACLSRQNGASMHLGSALMADAGRVLDSFGGKLDWIRVSSVARYSGPNFAVPTEDELVPDAQTNLLVTFNGNSANDAFTDLSPNHYTLTAGAGVSGGKAPPIVPDCNGNVIDDRTEVSQGLLPDSNGDGVPDGCQCGAIPELPVCCAGDIFSDGIVNGGDLGVLLSYWGAATASPASRRCDIDGNGIVNGADMGILLAGWGPCPGNNVPAWATALETEPDPSVVTDAGLRAAIVATGRPWRVRDNSTGIEMVLIPPGSFQMGCSASNAWGCWAGEYPVHLVTLTNAFYLGRCEVTQAQWQARIGSNPAYFSTANGQPGSDARPIERVSWNEIQAFLSSSGMRLPTEAEWEYAYRAGTTTAYHGWSATPEGTNDDSNVGEIGWYLYNTCYGDGCGTRAVGLKASNGFGLKDMLGNVWEWVNDWYDGYASGEQFDPNGPPSGTQRVFRGGSWFSASPSFNVRSSFRISQFPDYNNENIGFRVARNP